MSRRGLRLLVRRGSTIVAHVLALSFFVAVDISRAAEREDYVLHCAGCHKMDGSGSEVVPSLDRIGDVTAAPGGREYLVRVPGVAQAPLSDARLAQLMNWLIGQHAVVPLNGPYTAAEVKRLRKQPLRDPLAARKKILGAIE